MTRYESLVDKVTKRQLPFNPFDYNNNNVTIHEDVVSNNVPSLVGKKDVLVTELKNSLSIGNNRVEGDEYVNVRSTNFETTIKTKQNKIGQFAKENSDNIQSSKLASQVVVENFEKIMHQQEMEKNEMKKAKKIKSFPTDRLLMLDAKKASWILKHDSTKYKVYENLDGFKQKDSQYGNYYGFFQFSHKSILDHDAQIFMVGRDACKDVNDDRPALDLVMTRKMANGLGFTEIGTEIVMIPLLRVSQDKTTFRPGGYTSLLGSIQRRTANFSDGNYLNKVSTKMYEAYVAKMSFETIVKTMAFYHVQSYLESCFMDQVVDRIRKTEPLNQFKVSRVVEDHSINLNCDETDGIFKTFDENSARMIQTCANKCKTGPCGTKGLMYGSRVTKKKEGYVLPCGDVVADLQAYYVHPCAVRGRAVQYNSRESVCNPEINKLSLYGVKCQYCFRVYDDEVNSKLCSIFCHHVGTVSGNSYKTKVFGSLFNTESLFSNGIMNYNVGQSDERDGKKFSGKLEKMSYN